MQITHAACASTRFAVHSPWAEFFFVVVSLLPTCCPQVWMTSPNRGQRACKHAPTGRQPKGNLLQAQQSQTKGSKQKESVRFALKHIREPIKAGAPKLCPIVRCTVCQFVQKQAAGIGNHGLPNQHAIVAVMQNPKPKTLSPSTHLRTQYQQVVIQYKINKRA